MNRDYYKNDSAVSEVIGIILIVVIVTVLASLTALFVYGFLQNVDKPYIVDLTVKRINPNTIEILNNGGPDLADLNPIDGFTVTINGNNSTVVSGALTNSVGSSATYTANVGSHIIITGSFKDNKKHLLLDINV